MQSCGERSLASGLLEEYARARGYRTAMDEVMEPVLVEIGNRWSEEALSLAQGYVAGKVAEDLLRKINAAEAAAGEGAPAKGPLVLGNIEDDYHSLGRKLVDDAVLRKLTRAVLGQAGYTVIDAEDGEDAVAKFAANQDAIRLVILDGLMPKLGGAEALERIRRLSPGAKALFMSGYAEDLFSGRALRDGSTAFIQKPVLPTDLLSKVRELLDG